MARAAEELESQIGIESTLQAHYALEDFWENLIISHNVRFINILTGLLFSLFSWNNSWRTRICCSLIFCKIWNLFKTSVYVPYYIFTCLMQLAPNFKISSFCWRKIHFIWFRPGPLLKGTVLRDRFRKCWRKLTDLGLNKGRGWFLNFFRGTSDFWLKIKPLLSGKC